MIKTEKELMASIDNVIYGALDTPEEAVNFFLKNLLDKIDHIALFYPRRKIADTKSIKDRLIQREIEDSNNLIKAYNTALSEITLEWVNLAKKWGKPERNEVLIKVSMNFKNEANLKFNKMAKAALDHAANLKYIETNYVDLSTSEITLLDSKRNQLIKISKMTYNKFISDLKEDRLKEV